MNIWHLVLRELAHRRLNFVLALVSITVAIGCVVGAVTLLDAGEIQTGRLLAEREAEVERAGAELEDAMRKITKGLGFNVLILPEDQDPHELNLEGTLSKTMPEAYVDRLAQSQIVTVNHLLPTVVRKLHWSELDLSVLVYGTRGEVPILHADPKKPLLDAVPRDQMVVGFQIAHQRQLKPGATVQLLGRPFTILKVHEERGTVDDSTVWLNLAQAQEMFDLQNLIHAILALECNCASDRLAHIRKEIGAILPGTQVIERGPPALARAEARTTAKETAEGALARERTSRAQLQNQREGVAAVLVPLVLAGAGVLIALLALGNVRQRRDEIGILRALGCRSSQILGLFMSKALILGLLGAVLGYLAGFAFGVYQGDVGQTASLFDGGLLVLALLLAPALAAIGMWLPALVAARQDAGVLVNQ